MGLILSEEQRDFIERAKTGRNILVDACIGSGKTTSIQVLCNELPVTKNILYLTYNRLLKVDAKAKIKNRNTTVTNYHGFAYMCLSNQHIKAGISDLIQSFNKHHPRLPKKYDILILDEYQDIEQELAEMLEYIKEKNPDMQIIAVGDMKQKIYDKTNLNVERFIDEFLDDYDICEFTKCFRLSSDLADMLGRIWNKKIDGVNSNCKVEVMDYNEARDFLMTRDPKDVLCLGQRTGSLAKMLNYLEAKKPNTFNKHTVYASIRDSDGNVAPTDTSAIFTTFDSSKGLERPVCVIFDYTEEYWQLRIRKPMQSYEILRNIFCVAASRGKDRIIFVRDAAGGSGTLLSEETMCKDTSGSRNFEDVDISSMFDFKYKEDIEECFSLINPVKREGRDETIIKIRNKDCLIDLSPCIGIYQEATFFNKYSLDEDLLLSNEVHKNRISRTFKAGDSDDMKILRLVGWANDQNRYFTQIKPPFVNADQKKELLDRMATEFDPSEDIQARCNIEFLDKDRNHMFSALGRCDVLRDDTVYELKFTTELTHEHFLQCACYMIALGLKKGVLWNVHNNEMYDITIPNRAKFMNAVAKTVTKGVLDRYYKDKKAS
jgi:thymidine kinase